MKRSLDWLDALAALVLLFGVAGWAFLWAYPFPHPDHWAFLLKVHRVAPPELFALAGRIGLGVFAMSAYLVLRMFWMETRDELDDLPDGFFHTRTAPFCAAVAFTTISYAWRAGQYLSPGFALTVVSMLGLSLWVRGRCGRGMLPCCLAYLLMGVAAGANPLGVVVLGYAGMSDAIVRWRMGCEIDDSGDEIRVVLRKFADTSFSLVSGIVGFGAAAFCLSKVACLETPAAGIVARAMGWFSEWREAGMSAVVSPATFALAMGIGLSVMGLAMGRRIRAIGLQAGSLANVLSAALAIVAAVMFCRAVDRQERETLGKIREYAAIVADDVKDAKWLFTDGRLDGAVKLEFRRLGVGTVILNTMRTPTDKEAARLRKVAPELGDRDVFQVGGAEVLKAWARERPDRLAESAWQLGGGVIRRFAKVGQRTAGTVIRVDDPAREETRKAADARFVAWTRDLLARIEQRPKVVSLFGGIDGTVAEVMDGILWRAARMAGVRADQSQAANAVNVAEADRDMMRRLDEMNVSLRVQGETIERMLPTAKLVVTSREALDVALKRADFDLARRYAVEVLAGTPDDPAANFAMGMSRLEANDYLLATEHFERALKQNPREPATLNNLAIAYMKLGRPKRALECAEAAAAILPDSPQVRSTLSEVRKNLPAED